MSVPAIQNVFLIALSGVSYDEVVGNSAAPNINAYMAAYASSSAFSALAYPSEPNVLALSGGSLQDSPNNVYETYSSINLFEDRILAVGKTWKVYAESVPGDPTTSSGNYRFYYNPAIFYSDNYPTNSSLIVNYTQLATDLGATPPNFGWIIPNVTHNMSAGPSSIAAGDTFVGTAVSAIKTALPNSLIILWWDSDDGTGGNQVPLVLISPQLVEVGYVSSTPYNHYNLLSTIEDALNLTSLGANDQVSMDEFFAPGPPGGIFTAPVWNLPIVGGLWDESTWDMTVWASAGGPPDEVFQNSPFFFQFDAQGNPFPQYTIASGQLPPGLVLDPDFGTLSGVPQSLGTYMFVVQAANSQGSIQTPLITMKVVGPLSENIDNFVPLPNFTDPATSSQAVDGGEYYFTVSVTTSAGTGPISAPSVAAQLVVPPQPVTSLVAVGGNASATINWTAPTDTGGVPLTGYLITVVDMTLGSKSAAFYPPNPSALISGLSNGHTYVFVVQAANTDNKILSRGIASSPVSCAGISNLISADVPNPPASTPQPSYPQSVVSFTALTDYPNSPPRDIGYAFNVNALHPDTTAIEQIIGTDPYVGLPYETLQDALNDLAINRASLVHAHDHSSTTHRDSDDHPQYAKLDGSRRFTQPVSAPAATRSNQLVTLNQVKSYGFPVSSLTFGKNPVKGHSAGSVATELFPPTKFFAGDYPWIVVGGQWVGATAPDGLIQIPFQPEWESANRYSQLVLFFDFVFSKIPTNPTSLPYFDPKTDDLALYWTDLSHAVLYVSTTTGSPQRFLGISWMAGGL